MGAGYRLATLDDVGRLHHIRRQAILELAPPSMAVVEAEVWAAKLTLSGMERKLRELEIWVAELDGIVAGWGAIRGGYLEGLYIAPEFAGHGVGTGLLAMLEHLMRERSVEAIEAEASPNALAFYIRRGYRENGPQTADGAWPIAKALQATAGRNCA
ncbi:GNAT family N-acetyltransferase [Bradyrhizobium sp.]|uniref:GNAT family N-acetyltransferase n=1 Tax=Bradyrhizobium sp. TaxID=376 RepID=UPI002CFA084B|nr:GNAT family N-acetyltransferase [Bradyrhizobium sp.]HMM88896.1 GNAT family N-acetyltransferase [Bradyrhizobium sp.]